jgi:hypothetical protein
MRQEFLITPHLSSHEIACKCGCGLGREPGDFSMIMAGLFEAIRLEAGGTRITILSGCRCAAHNRATHGTENSTHMSGLALDLLPPTSFNVEQFFRICDRAANVGGAGIYDTFCHVDCACWPGVTQYGKYHRHRRWDERTK